MKVRATAGGVLVAIAALIVAVSFLAVYGDTFASHVGMTRDSAGRLAVRIALCPGEQVRSVEVATESAPRQSWRVTGPGSTADTWVVGAALPSGFVEVQSAPSDAFLVGDVVVSVETNQARQSDTRFYVLGITGGSVLFENEATVSSRFSDVALKRYPCDDPEGRLGTSKWVSRFLLAAAAIAACAAGLLAPERRHRSAGWYVNPDDAATVRWWDGNRWTVAVAVPTRPFSTGRRALPAIGTGLIVGGFLALLIAPAAGAEHLLTPEAAWVSLLAAASRGLIIVGVCSILIGFIVDRRSNR